MFPALFVLSFAVLSGFRKDAMLKQADAMAVVTHTHVYVLYI